MDCKQFEQNLFFIAERTLTEMDEQMQQHLETCSSCRKLYEQMKLDLAWIEKQKAIQPNPFMAEKVLNVIKQEEQPISAWMGWNKAVLMAAMLAGVYIGLNLGSFHHNETVVASNELGDELTYFDDFQQESIEYNLITEEE